MNGEMYANVNPPADDGNHKEFKNMLVTNKLYNEIVGWKFYAKQIITQASNVEHIWGLHSKFTIHVSGGIYKAPTFAFHTEWLIYPRYKWLQLFLQTRAKWLIYVFNSSALLIKSLNCLSNLDLVKICSQSADEANFLSSLDLVLSADF
jgi:hypothetical protein